MSWGWWAAAAMLLVAILGWWPRAAIDPPVAPDYVAQRDSMLATSTDVIQVAWAPPEIDEFAGVRGDVVWSNAEQRGFMRLSGMPVNDPAQRQYQLWIVDPARDAEPVDGGVFDIPEGGELVIPIDAKLGVVQPAAFAITREQPGGVVVSEGPLLVVAAVAQG